MNRLTRSLMAPGVAVALLAFPAATVATAQPALPPLAASATPHDQDAATAAAEYLAPQIVAGALPDDTGGLTIDALLFFTAAGEQEQTAAEIVTWLEERAADYATDGAAAGKLAVAAAATGNDPRDFGDVDLVAEIDGHTAGDGQCAEFGSAFGQSWCILGLVRAEAEVNPALVEHLLTYQDADTGAFGFDDGGTFIADADSSALALAALGGVTDIDGAEDAAVAVRDYLVEAQEADGSWPGFSPATTTGLVGSIVHQAGVDVDSAVQWLAQQQLDDGGLPSDSPDMSNFIATSQGAMLFTGESYLSVGPGGIDSIELPETAPEEPTATDEPEATDDPEATDEPGTDPEATDDATDEVTDPEATEDEQPADEEDPTPTAAPEPGEADDAGEGVGLGVWLIVAAVLLAVVVGAVIAIGRRKGADEEVTAATGIDEDGEPDGDTDQR